MKPPIDSVRLTATERDLLLKIKRKTGIDSWNVLCRWGLALGLKENNPHMRKPHAKRDAIEIKWETFAGKQSAIITSLVQLGFAKQISKNNGAQIADFFYSRLEDGIRTLSTSLDSNHRNLNALIRFDHPVAEQLEVA